LAKVIVGMTISLDGFVADQNGNAGRLYPDLERRSGALLTWRTLSSRVAQSSWGKDELGDPDSFFGHYAFQVPIFVLTHHPPSVAPRAFRGRGAFRERRGLDPKLETLKMETHSSERRFGWQVPGFSGWNFELQ
jgi:hypothetical protein